MSVLYEAESKGEDPVAVLAIQVLTADEFTESLVRAVAEDAAELDELIGRLSRGWPIDRMPTIDRLVLRIGVHELRDTDTPSGVVLNEAVELVKRFSTEGSAKFVNGVLAAAERELRPTKNA